MFPQQLDSQVKALVGFRVMTFAMAFSAGLLSSALSMPAANAQSDIEIDAENIIADSEAARAEEDEARLRAKEEKMRAEEAKKTAVREMEKAKRVEVEARTRVRKFEGDEKKSHAEREVAEKKTAEAQQRQAVANEKMRVAQEKLDATRAETEKAIALRDENEREADKLNDQAKKLESAVDGAKTKLARTLAEVNNSKGRIVDNQEKLKRTRIGGQKDLAIIRAKVLASRKELRALDGSLVKLQKNLKADKGLEEVGPMSDSSVGAPAERGNASDSPPPAGKSSGKHNPDGASIVEPARQQDPKHEPDQEHVAKSATRSIASIPPNVRSPAQAASLPDGWVQLTKTCDVRVAMSNTSGELGERRHAGEKLFAKKVDENWLKVKLADGSQGFMTASCFH